jgi:ferritin-like protein
MAHEGLHEESDLLGDQVIDRHRAIESLVEEFEAIDWYDQRVHATNDPDLASVLAHNRDDEKEHAAMALEWIRRRDPALDAQLRLYLFTDGPLVSVEDDDTDGSSDAGGGTAPAFGLGIGGLREAS